jgi:hypothetical protein
VSESGRVVSHERRYYNLQVNVQTLSPDVQSDSPQTMNAWLYMRYMMKEEAIFFKPSSYASEKGGFMHCH